MIDPTAFIAQGAVVAGNVSIGKESSIWYNTVVRGDMAPVRIGDQTNIQDLSMVHVNKGIECIIGNRVSVGHGAIIHGCIVDDDCLIGMGAILLSGVHLGTGSVVGAGAVLTEGKKIPPGSLVIGIPARVVRPVDDSLIKEIDFAWKNYLREAHDHRSDKVPLHSVDKRRGP